jgi:hypothetical protein
LSANQLSAAILFQISDIEAYLPSLSFATLAEWAGRALISIFLSGCIAWQSRVFARRSRRNVVKALTGFCPKELPLVIIGVRLRSRPGTAAITKEANGLPLVGYGPLVAYAKVSSYLLNLQSQTKLSEIPKIITSDQYKQLSDELKVQRDLLLLGYPASNEATRVLEPLMNLPVCFADNKRELISSHNKSILAKAVYEKTKVDNTISDSGLVVKIKHPFNADKNILYLAGCETFGVKIAADSLMSQNLPKILGFSKFLDLTWKYNWLPSLGMRTAIKSEFVAIFSADVNFLSTGKPELKYSWVRIFSTSGSVWKQTYPKE